MSRKNKKGENGKVLMVGGSETYTGAVTLAGLATLRSGVDWVTIAAPKKVAWTINSLTPDLITIKLPGKILKKTHAKKIIAESKKHDILLMGNGLGLENETIQAVKLINEKINKPKVMDADAIKVLRLEELSNTIITPHLKEVEMILMNSFISMKKINKIGQEKNVEKRAKLIKETIGNEFFENNIILLKGPVDSIIGKKIVYNKTGNQGMTKAGTGDVLAGLVAGFLAQSNDPLESARKAAKVNGQIGDVLLKQRKGFTYLASDMVQDISKFLNRKP